MLYIAHAVSEGTAQNKVFIYEPYLISQMAELISPENQVNTVKYKEFYMIIS
jgi:E3 ubiquitin-protein ligase HUWE1